MTFLHQEKFVLDPAPFITYKALKKFVGKIQYQRVTHHLQRSHPIELAGAGRGPLFDAGWPDWDRTPSAYDLRTPANILITQISQY